MTLSVTNSAVTENSVHKNETREKQKYSDIFDIFARGLAPQLISENVSKETSVMIGSTLAGSLGCKYLEKHYCDDFKNLSQAKKDLFNSEFSRFMDKQKSNIKFVDTSNIDKLKQMGCPEEVANELNNKVTAVSDRMKRYIAINTQTHGITAWHELGHFKSMDNKFGISVALSRKLLPFIMLPVITTAIFSKPNNKKEKDKNILDKSVDFIKNNAVSLAALSSGGIIADEVLASINGYKIAKKAGVAQEGLRLYKNVMTKGGLSYLIAPIAFASGAYALKKISEYIHNNKSK